MHGFHRVARGNWPQGMLTQVAPTSEASTDLSESDEEIGKLQVWKFRESWLILWCWFFIIVLYFFGREEMEMDCGNMWEFIVYSSNTMYLQTIYRCAFYPS